MPIKTELEHSGTSKPTAIKHVLQVEKRLRSDSELHNNYFCIRFMSEYVRLGHTKLRNINTNKPEYYLPHHPVFKEDSTTIKLRVVFDASEKTSYSLSLNDKQPGQVVMVREDNIYHQLKCGISMVKNLHAGNDEHSRVTIVQTVNAHNIKRAVNRLCPLPF